jgi:hypothetical protein
MLARCTSEPRSNRGAQGGARTTESLLDTNRSLRGATRWLPLWSAQGGDLGVIFACPRRGECLLELVNDDLEQPRGSIDVLQWMVPEVAKAGSRRKLIFYQVMGRIRDQDLASVRGTADPGCDVDGEPAQTFFAHRRLARVDSHPYADRRPARPWMGMQATLKLDRGRHGVFSATEDNEESISLTIDDLAAEEVEGPSEQNAVVRENALVIIAESLEQFRGALDVGEKKRDGPSRELSHVQCKVSRALVRKSKRPTTSGPSGAR